MLVRLAAKSAVAALAGALLLEAQETGAGVSFVKDIKPILETRCLKCHGDTMQAAKLDLRTREAAFRGSDKGPVIVAHKPEESSLFKKISGAEKPLMPMDGKLPEAQIAAIRAWIEQGAAWSAPLDGGNAASAKQNLAALEKWTVPAGARDQWAFRKPVKTTPPATGDAAWDRHPIDAFVRRTQLDRKLTPAPLASPAMLVRRAYLDLTGLPPTPAEARAFLDDKSPNAWEKLIDRLLDSPHYGERWGRHWLDVARYADSNGYEHDFDRPNAWRYRDYVIQAFNKDTPYNTFLEEQLAGDEMEQVTHERLIATGFLRNYAKVGFREKDNPQFRVDYLDDMIATLGRGVLGLTVQCARCHNHKFDPIGQQDYYKLQASLYGYVEVDHPLTSDAEAKAYHAKVDAVNARIKPVQAEMRALEEPYCAKLLDAKYRKWPQNIQDAVFTPEEKRTAGQVLLANQIIRTTSVTPAEIEKSLAPADLAQWKALQARIKEIENDRPKPIPVAMGITDGDYRYVPDGAGDEPAPGKGPRRETLEPGSFLADGKAPYAVPPSYFLHHGDMGSPGSVMKPGFVAVVDDGDCATEIRPAHQRTSGRRLALARWLTSRNHPLTSRVIVNRAWRHHFGRGIVMTLDNFGKVGEPPTHPELLDWLAVDFMDQGWSFKKLHKLIMTSRVYRLSSQFAASENLSTDADNQYLWRYRAQRLEAEAVRDSVLAVSGSLDRKMHGPAIFPQLPAEVLESMDKGIWRKFEDGPAVWRRSVYVYRKRGLPLPFFEVFDLPDQNVATGTRLTSTVPTQALTLLNNEWILTQARRLADRVAIEAPGGAGEQVDLVYWLVLSRSPSAGEKRVAQEFLAKNTLNDFTHVLLNLSEFIYLR